jgi:membrane-bound serine protease (ClpP class)
MKLTLRRAGLLLILLSLWAGHAPESGVAQVDAAGAPEAPAASESEAEPAAETPTAPSATSNRAAGQPAPRLSSLPGGANVAVIPIEGMIYDFTLESLQRRVDRALANGASVIVIEIDTYGGVVTAALDISKYLKDPTAVPVPTVAWVNDKAYSAGIIIASACDEIVMSPASATGDCAPIMYGQNLAPTERAKAYSPIATEFRNSAQSHGYTYATFHAMCVLGIDLYLIENPDTGQRLVVNQADYAVMVEGDKEARDGIRVESQAPAGGGGGGFLTLPGSRDDSGGGTVTTYNLAASNQAGPGDLGNWEPVEVLPSGNRAPGGRIHAGTGMLFTPDATLARDIGLSRATIANDGELQRYLGAASVTRVDPTWSEDLAKFLTQMWVRALLVVILAVGAYLELQAPGLGLPGAVALIALFGLFGAPMIIGLADLWHVLLFLAGLALLVAEVTLTPAFGVLGISGIILMLAALVLSVVPTGGGVLPAAGTWDQATSALLASLIGLVGAAVGLIALVHYFGHIPGLNRLLLTDTPVDAGPATATSPGAYPGKLSGSDVLGDGQLKVGQTGRVVSTLRPSGEAEFDGHTVDVVSIGPFVDPGTAVRITEVGRFTITVEPVGES